jgi:uncharacterized protein (DUF427 family)
LKEPRREKPGPGQESVWDYPRPPRVEVISKRIRVVFAGVDLADTRDARRVLETSHPPVYYIPEKDIRMEFLLRAGGSSLCEWKGVAVYFDITVEGRTAGRAAWSYPDPTPAFESIRNCVAFYPAPMDACYVDGEKARPQPGGFYGGWITDDIVGPFKGSPGTDFW